jgi:hypothetical protein
MKKTFSVILLTVVLTFGICGMVDAFNADRVSFVGRYPASPLTSLSSVSGVPGNQCTICHGPSGPPLNSFGSAFFTAGGGGGGATADAALAAIENDDSDGDTFRNRDEIDAGTFPGNAASFPADAQAPTVDTFVIPATSNSLTITNITFVATDDTAVTGYMITQSAIAPAASDPNWSATPLTTFTFPQGTVSGLQDLFAWAKDGAGNVSTSRQDSVDLVIIQATFADVPADHLFFNQVEAVAAQGITGGCQADDPGTPTVNEAMFCPDNNITRGQMAVFMETSLGVASAQLPACSGTVFNDVTVDLVGEVVCQFIEDFATRGITGGCQSDNPATTTVNEARFCPNDPVTRAQMAVFIEAALSVAPVPACTGTVFGDVTGTELDPVFCGFIEDFATQGITGGCAADDPATTTVNEARFCPNNPVTRGQMAVFLVAAPNPLLP